MLREAVGQYVPVGGLAAPHCRRRGHRWLGQALDGPEVKVRAEEQGQGADQSGTTLPRRIRSTT